MLEVFVDGRILLKGSNWGHCAGGEGCCAGIVVDDVGCVWCSCLVEVWFEVDRQQSLGCKRIGKFVD